MGLDLDLVPRAHLMPGGPQGNSNSRASASHKASTRRPLQREEAPFVHLRAAREPRGAQHTCTVTTRGLQGTLWEPLLEESLQ